MRFVYDGRKTAQAAAYLASLNSGRLNYMVLIKLLYLSDRQSLLDVGSPITGDRMVAMPHGPVLSCTYDLINMGAPSKGPCPWYEYFTEPDNYEVMLKREPDLEELSKYELDVLRSVYEKFGRMNKWALRDLTHTLPEWADPQGSSYPIDPKVILRGEGRTESEIEEVERDAEEAWFMLTTELAYS